MKDGSLLVSDDYNGAVYRVSYAPQHTASQVSEAPSSKRQ